MVSQRLQTSVEIIMTLHMDPGPDPQNLIDCSVQVLYYTLDQSKSGSACHMTRSANHRRHSVVI